jgi:hypothetical protein
VWLDGTLPAEIRGRSDPFLPYTWVLPLSVKGSAAGAPAAGASCRASHPE